MLYSALERASSRALWRSQETRSRSKCMHLSNDMTQEPKTEVPLRKNHYPRTDFQLRGFWLHMARGVWVVFLVAELLLTIISLFGSHGHGLTVCPFPSNCALTPATVQALHHAGIAP